MNLTTEQIQDKIEIMRNKHEDFELNISSKQESLLESILVKFDRGTELNGKEIKFVEAMSGGFYE